MQLPAILKIFGFLWPFLVFGSLAFVSTYAAAAWLEGFCYNPPNFDTAGYQKDSLTAAIICGLSIGSLAQLIDIAGCFFFRKLTALRFLIIFAVLWLLEDLSSLLWKGCPSWKPMHCAVIFGIWSAVESFPEPIQDKPIPAKNEIVMQPGSKIIAKTKQGTIKVSAGKGVMRSYTWEGATRSADMYPRDKRWYGSLGLYYPGPGEHWQEHNGITRGVLEEGQQRFKTEQEALQWLAARRWMPFVYRNDGLVVGWGKTLSSKQLDVEVWQIYINGKKPKKLPGSQDNAIAVIKN